MPTAQDVLNVARSLIGVKEVPDGSNIAPPITDWAASIGWEPGYAWCAYFVSYLYYHVDGGPILIHNKPTGYSGGFLYIGRQYGEEVFSPVVGAINVMDWDGGMTDHVGIVERVNSDGTWTNIEGNHQNQVMRVNRSFSNGNHWFVLPKYSSPVPPPPPKKEVDNDMLVPLEYVGQEQEGPDKGKHVFVASEGFCEVDKYKADCWLVIKNESSVPANIKVYTTPFSSFAQNSYAIPEKNNAKSRIAINMIQYMPKGGFATTVKSDNKNIVPQISMQVEKK